MRDNYRIPVYNVEKPKTNSHTVLVTQGSTEGSLESS